MEKRTVKLTKISKIQEELNNLAKEYEIAKENNDDKAKESIKERYEELKVLLRSNAVYFKNLNVENTSAAKEIEKKNYKNNKRYISMVEGSNSLDDYIERSKKINRPVKKHWKKVALGASILALVGGITSCSFNKKDTSKDNKVVYLSQDKIQEPTTEEIKLNDMDETKEDSNVKLNELPEETNKDNIKGNKNSNPNVEYTSVPEGKTIEKALDPHVDTTSGSTVTTNTIVIKEQEATEPTAEEYKTEIIDNTEISKEETVIIEETEEKEEKNTENIPIDGEGKQKPDKKEEDKKEEDQIPKEEKVIIIEEEIKEDINIDNLPIVEEETQKVNIPEEEVVTVIEKEEPISTEEIVTIEETEVTEEKVIEEETKVTEEEIKEEVTEIPEEEKVTVVEEEIKEDTNIENLPIEEETQEIIDSVSEETGYTLVYTM